MSLWGPTLRKRTFKIINSTQAGDVVVTQDWGLAAVVLGKEARSLSTAGREFHTEKIEFLLEEREVKAKYRRTEAGQKGHGSGPKRMTDVSRPAWEESSLRRRRRARQRSSPHRFTR